MHRLHSYKPRGWASPRSGAAQIPLAVKGLALIFFLCAAVRIFSAVGAETAARKFISELVAADGVVGGILDFELGGAASRHREVSLMSLIFDPSILPSGAPAENNGYEPAPPRPASSAASDGALIGGPELYYNNWQTAESNAGDSAENKPNIGDSAENKPNIITKSNTSPDSIAVTNHTGYAVDTAALLKEPLDIKLSTDSPAILIIHTHGSEAYMPDGDDQYVESDPYRTQDKSQSVIRVGDELASELAKKGIGFLHDRNFYDYPSYNGSYNRSFEAIQSYLKKYPSIKIVIDLHRDAIKDGDGNVYRTIAQVGDSTCSQVLFVMGTDASGLKHPNWKENLKLALHIQDEMNMLYPSLAKPITLSQYRYGQHATTGSMIVEVGSIGNTLQESLAAVRYFADAFSNVVSELYE